MLIELGVGRTHLAYAAMRQLRVGLPVVADLETFVAWIDQHQRPEGYRLVAIVPDDDSEATAVAGFRIMHSLAWSRYLYVDDLITLEASRGKGHANALFDWIVVEARTQGCQQIHLDSGMHRYDAHRFYLRNRFNITAHHFERSLG